MRVTTGARLPHALPQCGFALIALLAILATGMLYFLVGQLDSGTMRRRQDEVTTRALAQAKEALIGEAASAPKITAAGLLQVPDLGAHGGNPAEGISAGNFGGNSAGHSVIGKTPWQTLGVTPPRDGHGECLWYVVSGFFKNDGLVPAPNWDTQGQVDVIDGTGTVLASNVAALVVAAGPSLDGQNRSLADPAYVQCGGDYDAHDYLDSYNAADAIAGEVNYFAGSVNSRVAANTNNKRFVMAKTDHYNDRFLVITVDDIFRPIIRRSDFAQQVTALLDDPDLRKQAEIGHAETVAISGPGTKGANNIDCTKIPSNKDFCVGWKEMLLLKQLSAAGPITIDGTSGPNCSRVLFFGGQRTNTQARITGPEKANPANYLEGTNAPAFANPLASSTSFAGASTFTLANPSADLLRCLP